MSKFQLKMPKLGESVQEATIIKWMVEVGDTVEEDDNLLEIATDKVDSEIPSPVDGKILEIRFQENSLVPVGDVIAIIETDTDQEDASDEAEVSITEKSDAIEETKGVEPSSNLNDINKVTGKFFSPLVKSIAQREGLSIDDLSAIEGTGLNGRVSKNDVLNYLDQRGTATTSSPRIETTAAKSIKETQASPSQVKVSVSLGANDEIVQMDRMRKLIADHMVHSKHTSPHVTSMVEADVTNVVRWRNKVKDEFQQRYKTKLTYMPIITEAVSKALRDFPGVNAQVDGDNIVLKHDVNIGMAVSLPSGNLIVPVIKNADKLNVAGLAEEINELANDARNNKLSPDAIQGGTFTITNFGSFKNVMGTPIINQPQVAILATGSIEKKPAVMETPDGDVIVVRQKMFLSLSYDHRVVDGMLGGGFVRRIADYLEQWDVNRSI